MGGGIRVSWMMGMKGMYSGWGGEGEGGQMSWFRHFSVEALSALPVVGMVGGDADVGHSPIHTPTALYLVIPASPGPLGPPTPLAAPMPPPPPPTPQGATGLPLTNVVSIGIGGSYLGPEFVFEALRKGACPRRPPCPLSS